LVDVFILNFGYCLWIGIVDEVCALWIVELLVLLEMFSGWGICIFGVSMGVYDLFSYYNGLVWFYDIVLCVSGLMCYGFVE